MAQVTSVYGRTGAVIAQTGDYNCAKVTNCGSKVGANTWTASNTFGPQTNISVPYDGTTSGPTNIPVIYHTGAFNSGLVSPRSAALLQMIGIPVYAFGSDEEVNLVNAFAYGGAGAYNLERYDRGTVPTTAATPTTSATLQFANTPFFVTAGAVVTDVTTGLSIGTVLSKTGTTITLTANAANPVSSGDVLNIVGVNNGALQNRENIGDFGFDPYDGVSDANTASIGAYTTEVQSNSGGAHGTGVTITYTPNGAGANKRYTGITISHGGNGGVTVGDTGYQTPPTDLGSGTLNVVSDIATSQHFRSLGPKPTLSACGTGGSVVVGTDNAGLVTVGAGVTACTVNFASSWSPICVVTMKSNTSPLVDVDSISTSGFTVKFSAAYSGSFYYICQGFA